MRILLTNLFFAIGSILIVASAAAEEPMIYVKEDGTVSVHCRIANGKDAATFSRIFGAKATTHGDCSNSSDSEGLTVASGETGGNPEPIGGNGGGVAPVCVCPESMVEDLQAR